MHAAEKDSQCGWQILHTLRGGLKRSATTWASGRTGNPYFVIPWASMVFDSRLCGLFHIWGCGIFGFSQIFTHFHPFSHAFCSFLPHPLLSMLT